MILFIKTHLCFQIIRGHVLQIQLKTQIWDVSVYRWIHLDSRLLKRLIWGWKCNNSEYVRKKTTWTSSHVSCFMTPPLHLRLGAFCALKEVISRGDAGGGVLEIDQWQICGSESEQLEMMKLSLFFFFSLLQVCPHLYTHTHLVGQWRQQQ